MIAAHSLACAAVAAMVCAGLRSQQIAPQPTPFTPQRPADLTQQFSGSVSQNPSAQQLLQQQPGFGLFPQVGRPVGLDQLNQQWVVPRAPDFAGFPVFPSRLSGYGNYPLPVDPSANPTGLLGGGGASPFSVLLPPAEPEPPGWPSWVRTSAKEPLPFAPDRALLVRKLDRVRWRNDSEEPFVPLFFHDKFATLTSGGEVRVDQAGEFALFLHTSTEIQAWGPTLLRLEELSDQNVRVAITKLTKLRIEAQQRTHTIRLPDGSTLALSTVLDSDDGFPQPAQIELVRQNEPDFYAGRATLTNLGQSDVLWRHALGTQTLAPRQRVRLFLQPPAAPTPMAFDAGQAAVEGNGASVVCTPDGAGEVQWCGARFALGPGMALTFESLQGEAFGQPGDGPATGAPGSGDAGKQ